MHRESWTASGDLADLHASLADACPALHELLGLMDAALITAIYFRDPLETWGPTASCCSATPPTRPRPAPGRGPAWPSKTPSCSRPACGGPGRQRAGGPARIRLPPPAAHHPDAVSSRVNLRNSQTSDPVQVRAVTATTAGCERLSPAGPPMQEWLLGHDPVAAAVQSPAEFEQNLVVPANPMRRPQARRAYDLWRAALTGEHRAAGWLGERRGYAEFLRAACARPPATGRPPRSAATGRPPCGSGGRGRTAPRPSCTCTAAAT